MIWSWLTTGLVRVSYLGYRYRQRGWKKALLIVWRGVRKGWATQSGPEPQGRQGYMEILDVTARPGGGPLQFAFRVRCAVCQNAFHHVSGTVASIPLARFTCPVCGRVRAFGPGETRAMIARFVPHFDAAAAVVQAQCSNRILEQWHTVPAWREALCRNGINLGQSAEYDLNGILSLTIYGILTAGND